MLTSQNIDPNDPNQRRFFLLRWIVNAWHWLVPPSVAHADRESAGSRKLRAGLLISICLALIITGAFYARPMKHAYDEHRAAGLVEDAERFLRNGDPATALVTAQKAHQLAPDYVPSLRFNARILTQAGREEAEYFWREVERHGAATSEDMKGKVRALIRINKPKEARQLLQELLGKNPNDKDMLPLTEEVWGKQQVSEVVLKVLEDYVAQHPEDRASQLRLQKLKFGSGNPVAGDSARDSLKALSEGKDQEGLDALRFLSEQPSSDIHYRQRLADQLENHPLATAQDRVQALEMRVKLNPADKNKLIDHTALWFQTKKSTELLPFVDWLRMNQEFGRVLTMLNEQEIKKKKEDLGLLLAYMSALTFTGRLQDLERLVNDPEIRMPQSTRAFYLAHLSLIKGASADVLREKLNAARATAVTDGAVEILFTLGSYCADKLKFYEIALEAYEDLAYRVAPEPLKRTAFERLMHVARLAGDSDAMAKSAMEAHRRWLDDKGFLEDLVYVNLLRGERIEWSLEQSDLLLQMNPEDTERKIVHAFGLFRIGDFSAAVQSLQKSNLNTLVEDGKRDALSIAFAAVVHAAGPDMVAGGDTTLFNRQLRSILKPISGKTGLLPEESRLLNRVRQTILESE